MANISSPPLWQVPPTIGDMGGGVNKRNAVDQEVVNPETDVSVEQYNLLCQTAVQVARTSPFAVLYAALGSSAQTLLGYRAHHAIGPDNGPTVSQQGSGHYRFEWEPTYTDEFGQEAAINLVASQVQVHGLTPLIARPVQLNAYTLDVLFYAVGGTVTTADIHATVLVWSL